MKFELVAVDEQSCARAGILKTSRGDIHTPIFMPVGTLGTVKTVHQYELANEIGAEIILGNTYHLYLRPGTEILKQAGGLHAFMNWQSPILTDSGGYQVYSLSERRRITEEGVSFASHIDGSKHFFSPEKAVEIQREIGADIIMAFDECPPYPSDYSYAKESMELTHRWLDRCCQRMQETEPLYGKEQVLAPIIQGSTFRDLRIRSTEFIASKDAPLYAIGGLSVGEPHELMYEFAELSCAILPDDRARYLMGVGTPANLLECISLGVDMFDCVLPTRNARHGLLYTYEGVINIKNAKWKDDFSPIDANGMAKADKYYSKAYLRHLFQSGEYLAAQIASQHNLSFYLRLVKDARAHIVNGSFHEWKKEIRTKLENRL
jgi:queuine tRNA-ribosyltransferase